MMGNLRIATFNLENLDDKAGEKPSLEERMGVLRPQMIRLDADIICLQEIHGQEETGQPRRLLALDTLLRDTPYAEFNRVSTMKKNGSEVYDERNLVILSRYPIVNRHQYTHSFAEPPRYRKVTANPPEQEAKAIGWERPILHAEIQIDGNRHLHVINIHLKSRIPTNIAGQKVNNYTWKTASAWAEGYFISSMKRVGQAMEVRMLIDQLFDQNPDALIFVCGDFNADVDDVPVAAIRGDVEDTGNAALANRIMVPCEHSIPEPSRFSLLHQGKGVMLDHILISRPLLAHYRGAEVHNEILHDESIAFATDRKYPESDHAPVIANFQWQTPPVK